MLEVQPSVTGNIRFNEASCILCLTCIVTVSYLFIILINDPSGIFQFYTVLIDEKYLLEVVNIK